MTQSAIHATEMASNINESEGTTLAEKNRKFFNTASKTVFESKWVQDLQQQIREHLRTNIEWIGINETKKQNKMLDYACGNGIPSQVLSPHFATCIGMDVSEGMLEIYNRIAQNQNPSTAQMRGIKGDLMADDVDPALLTDAMYDFDLVVISMALHHIEHPSKGVQRLVERLRIGGVLLVVDWATTTGQGQQSPGAKGHHHDAPPPIGGENGDDLGDFKHQSAHTVAHNSFSREQMEDMFMKVGCKDIDFVLATERSVVPMAAGEEMQLLFARGIKSAL